MSYYLQLIFILILTNLKACALASWIFGTTPGCKTFNNLLKATKHLVNSVVQDK